MMSSAIVVVRRLRRVGPSIRVRTLRRTRDNHIPAMALRRMGDPVTYYACGACVAKLPDDPFRGRPGRMHTDGIPRDARCFGCGRPAWPKD